MSQPIPQPRGIPLLGNIFDVDPSNTWSSLATLARKHGEIFKLTILGHTLVCVAGAALAEELCDERRFRKYVGGPIVEIRDAVHDALFTAYEEGEEGEEAGAWGVAHRICAPVLLPSSFSASSVRDGGGEGEAEQMGQQRAATPAPPGITTSSETVAQWVREIAGLVSQDLLRRRWLDQSGDDNSNKDNNSNTASVHADRGQGILLVDELNRLNLEATTLTLFGRRLHCITAADPHPMLRGMEDATSEAMKRPTRLRVVNWLLHGRKWQDAITTMRQRYAREEILEHRRRNPTGKRDLLGALLQGKDPVTGTGLRESQVVDEIVSMPIGSSTAPCAIASAVYFLCRNRACWERARREVDGVWGPWGADGRGNHRGQRGQQDDDEEGGGGGEQQETLTPDHLEQLKYIQGIVRETLRLSCAAPGFNIEPRPRTTASGHVDTSPVLLGGGKYAIAHDQAMIIVLAGVNTDKAVFGDDADEFRPERMMDAGDGGGVFGELPAGVKKWFGNGKRACIGREWAWVFMVTVVALLVRECDFEIVDEDKWAWKQDGWFNIRPVGLRVRVQRRTE